MKAVLMILLFVSSVGFAQTDTAVAKKEKKGSIFKDAADIGKMAIAKQKMYASEYASALNTYREVEKNNPTDGTVLYYIGFCNFALGEYVKSKEYLLKAETSTKNFKPETHFMLGKIYQREDDFDKAIEAFTKYKSSPSTDKENVQESDIYLSQCETAKKLIATPLDVTITNLGPEINTKYNDKNPCITHDGRTIVFTTNRPAKTDSPVDKEGDGKYFEDIYTTVVDSATKQFGPAHPVPGSVNTKGHDACTSISPDGKQIFIYKNDINDRASYGGEIFVTKIVNGKWKTAEPLGKPISSEAWEGGACISADGKKYFFVSERKGGYGHSDIWMVTKKTKKEWDIPVNLGPDINSANDEAGVFLAPDGKTLFFCSNGPTSMGSSDVFKTVFADGKWSKPVNLGYPINSSAKEGQLSLSADAKFAYVSSERKGGLGESDLYKIDLKDFAILEPDGKKKVSNGLSILKGTIREGFEGYGLPDVEISLTDEAGAPVSSTNTNENGEYFFTLKGGNYNLSVKKKGYQDITEKVELKVGEKETLSLEKGFLLKKS